MTRRIGAQLKGGAIVRLTVGYGVRMHTAASIGAGTTGFSAARIALPVEE
jgi:hypothetical protein